LLCFSTPRDAAFSPCFSRGPKTKVPKRRGQRLAHDSEWNRLKGFTLMLFVMLYAPCLVTVSVIRRESGSWKWAAFSTVYSTTIAFTLTAGVYQLGRLF